MEFKDAKKEAEFIESIRSIFRAYVPESDAWAKPNFFDINATVIGGIAWSAVNEARNGVDLRLNPQTAVGEYLDIIAATPPLDLTRRAATQATGFVKVDYPVTVGYEFKAEDGTIYTATEAGSGVIAVISKGYGKDQNSIENRPLEGSDGTARSLGIWGGYDVECDDQFRRRIYAAKSKFHFFGSACSYEDALLAFPGVTRVWTAEDGGVAKIMFLMEDKYPCGQPRQEDIDEIIDYFKDECLSNMFFCPNFEGACTKTIAPEIEWTLTAPEDICEVQAAMTDWLRENYDIGEGVKIYEIQCWLDAYYPEYGGKIPCCDDYEPEPCCVYNCVQLLGCA